MKLQFVSDFQTIAENRHQWDAIAGNFPLFQHAWLANWYRELGQSLKLAILIGVDEDGNWVGIAPWCVDRGGFTSKLRFIGSGSACTDYMRLLCAPHHHEKFSQAAVDWLVENIGNPQTLGAIDVVELDGIAVDDPQTSYFCQLLEACGMKSFQSELEGSWIVPLPSTWDEFTASLCSSMRRKTRKATRRLADPASEIISSDSQQHSFEELWPVFVQLHQQRREMLGQPGCFADPSFETFLKSASTELHAQSAAELLFVYHNGSPLACMLLFNDQETTYMYQSGMDTTRLDLEPGYQIAYVAIKRTIEKGRSKFDFLRGDEPYKSRWKGERTPLTRRRFIPRTTRAELKHTLWLTGRTIKNYLSSHTGS